MLPCPIKQFLPLPFKTQLRLLKTSCAENKALKKILLFISESRMEGREAAESVNWDLTNFWFRN
jgi:hypothetical protein